jgi:hypothetical protein
MPYPAHRTPPPARGTGNYNPRYLRTSILLILRRDTGRTMDDLAVMTGAPMADVKRCCWSLLATPQAGWCAGYVTSAPRRRP